MSNIKNTSGGIGFAKLLTIAFIVLKLTHIITWSWFWVLSPLIFSISFFILVLIIMGIMAIRDN